MSTSNTWMLQSVCSFWQNVNWENKIIPLVTNSSNGKVGEPLTLSLALSVQQYFSMLSWSGGVIAAVPISSSHLSESADEPAETLDDFLDDISKFF